MSGIVLIGAQWGDEGKGKATDLIGTKVDYVARFNGGNNGNNINDSKFFSNSLLCHCEGVT